MIIDLIDTYKTKSTVISGFSVGTFVFDCTTEEAHESRLTITENAMESGALVADHSYLEPATYSVRGLMVSYDPPSPLQAAISKDIAAAKALPFLGGIVAKTEQLVAKVNRFVGNVKNTIDTARNIANKLAPFLPDSLGFLGDNTQKVLSRQAQAYDDLLTIQRNGQFLQATSGLKSYSNVLLTGVVAVDGSDDAVEFSLQFREVFVVETQTVQGLVVNIPSTQKTLLNKNGASESKVDGSKKTGRAETQAATTKAMGKTQPTRAKTPSKSVARSIGDLIRGS